MLGPNPAGINQETLTTLNILQQMGSEAVLMFSVPNMPLIKEGNAIGAIIAERMNPLGGILDGDIVLVASKAVSWAEADTCLINLSQVTPGKEAQDLSTKLQGRKSPKIAQLILEEAIPGTLEYFPEGKGVAAINIAVHRRITSAGVDKIGDGTEAAMILPRDPDASARRIMEEIRQTTLKSVAVILTDSEGRPDIRGAGAIAIGCAGIDPLRISSDNSGKQAEETLVDFFANSAAIPMGQRDKGVPAVIIRGHQFTHNPDANLKSVLHNKEP